MSNTSAINLGTCWSCVGDLTMPAQMASGFQCVGEAIARRWGTTRGQLIDDPNYGQNAVDAIGDDYTAAQLAYFQQQLAAEAQKDERVLAATVVVVLTVAGLLTITGQILTAAGPFTLVCATSATTVTLLLVSP